VFILGIEAAPPSAGAGFVRPPLSIASLRVILRYLYPACWIRTLCEETACRACHRQAAMVEKTRRAKTEFPL